jgi:hypothetical protein
VQYVANPGQVVTAANAAKSLLSILSTASIGAVVVELGVSFDGTSATATPILIELCKWDNTTAGTGSSTTPIQVKGTVVASAVTAAFNYTVEPTVLTPLKQWLVSPTSGLVVQFPLGREPSVEPGTKGLVLRATTVTASGTPNARPYIEFAEGLA